MSTHPNLETPFITSSNEIPPTILIVEGDRELQAVIVEVFQHMLCVLGKELVTGGVAFCIAETLQEAMDIVSTRCHRLLFMTSEVVLPHGEKAVQAVEAALAMGLLPERIAFLTFRAENIRDYQAVVESALREVSVFRKPFSLRRELIPHIQPRLKQALEEMGVPKIEICPD